MKKIPKFFYNPMTEQPEAYDPKEDEALKKIMADVPKKFNHYDKTTYPSDPEQRRKLAKEPGLFENVLNNLKAKSVPRSPKKVTKIKKKPVAENFTVDTTGLSSTFNNYVALKEKQEQPKKPEPVKPKNSRGGLEDAVLTDEFYLRMKGI